MTAPALLHLISKVFSTEILENDNKFYTRFKALNQLLRVEGHWPSIQTKRFFDNSGLVLIYNSHKNYDMNQSATPFHKEARSVVVNLEAETPEQSIVSSLSSDTPVRMSDKMYLEINKDTDILETGYEGTMISVYFHRDKWYFSTSTCPNINSSRYFHPTKTHGEMLNEFLAKTNPDGLDDPRQRLTEQLDTERTYMFVLVHHENRHLMDYTPLFGSAYSELFHISTQHMGVEEPIHDRPLENLGVRYPTRFEMVESAMYWLKQEPVSYAVIVKREDGSILKVCQEDTIFKEEVDLGNANPWHNMLWIFLKNRPDFTVANYARGKRFQQVLGKDGRPLSPTFVIHSALSAMTSFLHNLYHASTYYNLATKQLVFKAKMDKEYSPIIRFHLVQLRNIQKNQLPDRLVNMKVVSDYLRNHQTMKNIRMLIAHFANHPEGVDPDSQYCMESLHNVLLDGKRKDQ